MSAAGPAFVCDGCGACCRRHRVPVTHADVRRLRAVAPIVDAWLEWLRPEDVDMEGEPESFVQLAGGRRLLVLTHVTAAAGSHCAFLATDGRCSVYEARPASCRTYPFERPTRGVSEPAGLTLHDSVLCDASTHVAAAGAGAHTPAALDARDEELIEYVALVTRWNRRQRRRVLGGRRPEPASEYLTWLERNTKGG